MPGHLDRSRSPHRSSHSHDHERIHRRRRSPHSQADGRHSYRDRHSSGQPRDIVKPLPLDAAPLSKYELRTHRPLFALYLDVQKQLDIEDLPEDEVKGRWKSFVKKWNAGDLAEGWYDPKTFEKARRGVFGVREDNQNDNQNDNRKSTEDRALLVRHHTADSEDEDDEFGPELPTTVISTSTNSRNAAEPGPSIPSASDLRVRNEQAREDADSARDSYIQSIHAERKADRRIQQDRLDELVPRAEAGSRERQLEKKRDLAASNRAFAAAKDGDGDADVRDADVMGDEDSLGELKRMKEAEQRKKTEREIRREEILRAKAVEREERVKGMREKEAKTMEMLKSIARARFGGGNEE